MGLCCHAGMYLSGLGDSVRRYILLSFSPINIASMQEDKPSLLFPEWLFESSVFSVLAENVGLRHMLTWI